MSVSVQRKKEIARVAYEAYAAYGRLLGDDYHLSWEEAGEDLQAIVLVTVERYLKNPELTVEEGHNQWVAEMLANDWVFAEDKSVDLKTHPLLVAYDELSVEQQAKSHILKSIITSMATIPEMEIADKVVTKEVGRMPVKYIGKRDSYTDGLYKTGLTWKKGETIMVEDGRAVMLLKHPDQYELGEISKIVPVSDGGVNSVALETKADNEKKDDDAEADNIQELKDTVSQMGDVEAVKAFAFEKFAGKKLHHNVGLETAKTQVIQLIDQFGVE
ncbi:MAG: hypothetical protein KAV87_22470 [Desulfobacteraceae bacterium]|nr:hypothetical protein [Desulfobacteraceae bacterium]